MQLCWFISLVKANIDCFLTCIYLRRHLFQCDLVTEPQCCDVIIASGIDTCMMPAQWNLLEAITLALATDTPVWARNAEQGKGGREAGQNKRYPLRR